MGCVSSGISTRDDVSTAPHATEPNGWNRIILFTKSNSTSSQGREISGKVSSGQIPGVRDAGTKQKQLIVELLKWRQVMFQVRRQVTGLSSAVEMMKRPYLKLHQQLQPYESADDRR